LPPVMAFYYRKNHADYKSLPPFRADCLTENQRSMDFIYPPEGKNIILPKDFDGNTNPLVIKIAHSKPGTPVFWYLDEQFIGTTQTFHEMSVLPETGKHLITAIDSDGLEIKRWIDVKR